MNTKYVEGMVHHQLFVGPWLKEIPGTVKQEYANEKHFLSNPELIQRKGDN